MPVINDGLEFGFGWDEGPETVVGGVQIAPAWDVGILDGEVYNANAAYQSVYEAIDSRRLGGVGFTMLLDPDLSSDPCEAAPPS